MYKIVTKRFFPTVSSLKQFRRPEPAVIPAANPSYKIPRPHPINMTHPNAEVITYRIKNRALTKLYEVPLEARIALMPYFEIPDDSKLVTVSIIGAPNAGKSSLINKIVGKEVLAVSRKTNTTQEVREGILTEGETQLVLQDTPGILSTHGSRTNAISSKGWEIVKNNRYALFVVDPMRPIGNDIRSACSRLQGLLQIEDDIEEARIEGESDSQFSARKKLAKKPIEASLVVAKTDLVKDRRNVKYLVNELQDYAFFENVFYVSAFEDYNIQSLIEFLKTKAEEADWIYHPNQITNLSDVEQVQDCVLKYILETFHNNLPYEWVNRVIGWTPYLDGTLRVDIEILVGSAIQKGIFIGRESRNIKKIAAAVQADLTRLYGRPVRPIFHVHLKKEHFKHLPDTVHPRFKGTSKVPQKTIEQFSKEGKYIP